MKQRIAILADFPWSFFDDGATGRGGGQHCTWLTQIAEAFTNDCPYEIHWISIRRRMSSIRTETKEWGGQSFHRIPGIKISMDLRLGFQISKWQLSRILGRIQPDLVHCWGSETAYPIVCNAVKCPTILSMQGVMTNLSIKKYLPDIWYLKKLPKLEPTYIRTATFITCESKWAIDRILEIAPRNNISQVEYGVHPSFYDVRWKPDLEHPYALFVGTLTEYKGLDVLLDAIQLIENRKWTLKIAGDGPMRETVKSYGIPNVELLGVLDWNDLQNQMKGAQCLVHPTLADSSPNAVKEARVIGLPVITTIHGGQAGYIVDGENGIIVNPLEPTGLAAALSRLMENPELAKQMGACRHAKDRAYFRSENTAKGFIKIYDELLGNTGGISS